MKVTIEEKSAKPVFNRGNLVVHIVPNRTSKIVVMVQDDISNTAFAGTVLFCNDATHEVGFRTSGWTKASFEPFTGKLTIEV